jgi:hypothetical protein
MKLIIELTLEQAVAMMHNGELTIKAATNAELLNRNIDAQAEAMNASRDERTLGGPLRPLNIVPVDGTGCELLPSKRRVVQNSKRYGFYTMLDGRIPPSFVVGSMSHNIIMALAQSGPTQCITAKDMTRLCGKRYGAAMRRLRRYGLVKAVKLA